MLFLPIVILGQNNENDSKKIENRIWAFLHANKNTLLGKDNNGLKKDSIEIFTDLQKELSSLENLNSKILNDFKKSSIAYKNGKIEDINYIEKNIYDNSAEFIVSVSYKFNFNTKTGMPPFTKYDEIRSFNFIKDKNRWVLKSQKLHIDGLVKNPSEVESNTERIDGIPAQITGVANFNTNINENYFAFNNQKNNGPNVDNNFPPIYYYDPVAASKYAIKYAKSGNTSSYRTYGKDCTNFVSQCLAAGGWNETGSTINRTQSDVWFYSSLGEGFTSYTWAGANNHYQFHKVSTRSTMGTSTGQLRLGDILQVDFHSDGIVDHSVIVSTEYASGADFVSYHSTNTLDKPLSQFISDCLNSYPLSKFYVWLVKRN